MAVIEGGTSALLAEVGLAAALPLHATLKPIPHGALGHYRVSARLNLGPAQAANSRLFTLRNSGANLIIVTRLLIKWMQTAAHTAAIEDSLDCFKCTAFSASDNTGAVTLSASRKRTTMGATPGNVEIRYIGTGGVAPGMTGGTLTKDASPFAQLQKWLQLAQPTAGPVDASVLDAADDANSTHPFIYANNEGFEIENRVLLGASAASSVVIDVSYAEVTLF